MRRSIFIAMAVFLFSVSLPAQSVDEIIAKHIAAQGGLSKLNAIETVQFTAHMDAGSMQADITEFYKRPLKIRVEITVNGLTSIAAFDGNIAWKINGFGGPDPMAPVRMPADQAQPFEKEVFFGGPLMDYKEKGNTVDLIGKEKVEGKDAFHFKVLKNDKAFDLYLDADTFLLTKVVSKRKMRGVESEVQLTVSDYREVQGMKFPFSLATRVAGGDTAVMITFKTIAVNVALEDSIFKMPGGSTEKTDPAPTSLEK